MPAWLMAPRGLGTMVVDDAGRPADRAGRLPRYLVFFGFGTMAVSLWGMTDFTPDVSYGTIVWTGFYQGIGMGFVFTPLSTLTFATLAAELRPQAASLFALMRSMGGAIGISALSSLLLSSLQANHADIAAYVTPFNRLLQSGAGLRFWNPASVPGRAMLDGEITRQAMAIAYIDDFWLITVIALLAMPLILMLKAPGRAIIKQADVAVE